MKPTIAFCLNIRSTPRGGGWTAGNPILALWRFGTRYKKNRRDPWKIQLLNLTVYCDLSCAMFRDLRCLNIQKESVKMVRVLLDMGVQRLHYCTIVCTHKILHDGACFI